MHILDVYQSLLDHEYTICTFALFINMFHLLVLTRRYMRTSSIYILFIGICLSEMYSMSITVKLRVEQVFEAQRSCSLPLSVFRIYLNRISLSAAVNTHRLSIWLTVSFAVIRAIVLRKIPDNLFQMLSAPGFGWLTTFFLFLASFVMTLSHYFKDQIVEVGMWTPSSGCEAITLTERLTQYTLAPSDLYTFHYGIFEKLFFISNGCFTYVIPTFILSITIVLLVLEVLKFRKQRKAKKSPTVSKNQHQYRNEQTTKLVLVLSLLTFLIILLHSTLFISKFIFGTEQEVIKLADAAMKWMFAINSAGRCFLCAIFSCRYRNAIRRMFGLADKLSTHKATSTALRGNSTPRSVISISGRPTSPKHESK